MLARVAVPDQFLCPCIEVLLPNTHAFPELWRSWLIKDSYARARSGRYFNPKQSCSHLAPRTDGPDLSRRQGIAFDCLIAVQLWSRNELLHSFSAEGVAEVSIAELAFENALLLLLDAPARFECEPDNPFHVLVWNHHRWVGK